MAKPPPIKKNIPIPEITGRGQSTRRPYRKMKSGDSFFVKKISEHTQRTIHNGFKKTGLPGKIITRKVRGGFRVWYIFEGNVPDPISEIDDKDLV